MKEWRLVKLLVIVLYWCIIYYHLSDLILWITTYNDVLCLIYIYIPLSFLETPCTHLASLGDLEIWCYFPFWVSKFRLLMLRLIVCIHCMCSFSNQSWFEVTLVSSECCKANSILLIVSGDKEPDLCICCSRFMNLSTICSIYYSLVLLWTRYTWFSFILGSLHD